MPGSRLSGDRLRGLVIAYNADESDLLTQEAEVTTFDGLRTIADHRRVTKTGQFRLGRPTATFGNASI
jgi:hypothetical protein